VLFRHWVLIKLCEMIICQNVLKVKEILMIIINSYGNSAKIAFAWIHFCTISEHFPKSVQFIYLNASFSQGIENHHAGPRRSPCVSLLKCKLLSLLKYFNLTPIIFHLIWGGQVRNCPGQPNSQCCQLQGQPLFSEFCKPCTKHLLCKLGHCKFHTLNL
jgi:hypothetical protein